MTNDKAIKNLIKTMDKTPMGIGHAILRERLLKIAELTRKNIETNPTAWENPFISKQMYFDFCDTIEKELSFDNK